MIDQNIDELIDVTNKLKVSDFGIIIIPSAEDQNETEDSSDNEYKQSVPNISMKTKYNNSEDDESKSEEEFEILVKTLKTKLKISNGLISYQLET
ncbi:hypothetical protein BpHYR1_010336 [Brachionus plicatilis]|uniref:Uncharacterized protein n=1 Tax=Brachionus plicatilis TaxID=10195 RepID=A0A3M7T8G5_BRAPC|nr:hypothetical protein BpHYR1_010336 [Brachionus plicatilis]